MLIPLVVFFFLAEKITLAQSPVKDSLRRSLQEARTDSARAFWCGRLAWTHLRYDLDTAEWYARQARQLYLRENLIQQAVAMSHYQGLVHRLRGEYAAALDTFHRVLAHYTAEGDTFRMTSPLFNLGVVYSMIGDYEQSLRYYYQELQINEAMDNVAGISNSLNSIGNLQKSRDNLPEAIATYERAIGMLDSLQHQDLLATTHHNLADAYLKDGDLTRAAEQARRSLAYDEQLNRPWGVAFSLVILGDVARQERRYEQAIGYLTQALSIRQQLEQPRELALTYQALGNLALDAGLTGQALTYWQEALRYADEIGFLDGQAAAYAGLADAYELANDYRQAFSAQKAYQVIRDSLMSQEKTKALEELDVRYAVSRQQREMEVLQAENIRQRQLNQRERRLRLAWTLLAILLGLVAAGGLIWYRQRLAHNRLVSAQAFQLQDARIQQLEQEQKMQALNAMMSGQEQERKRIASDLHDSLGSLLSTIKLHVQATRRRLSEAGLDQYFGQINQMIDQASADMRRISHAMMPDVLQLGLSAALQDLVHRIGQTEGIIGTFQQTGTVRQDLPEQRAIMWYRIVQELVQNALKHADARHILVQLSWETDSLSVTVEDDGQGFDPEQVTPGLGQKSLASRVQYLSGHMDLVTQPGEGTSVEVRAPYEPAGPLPSK